MLQLRFKGSDTVHVLLHDGIVDADSGDDVEVVKRARQHEVLKVQVVEVPAVRASVPSVRSVARQVVRPRPDAALSCLVLGGVVIAHRPAAHRTTRELLEEIREPFALAAALAFLAQERHVLHSLEQRVVDDFRVVARDDFLSSAAILRLEFGDVFADNRPVAQQFIDVALMPDGLPRVPGRNAFLEEGADDDATAVSSHVHLENSANQLRAFFEHMEFAITDFEPAGALARRDDAVLGQLAFRFPVRTRSEGLVFGFAV